MLRFRLPGAEALPPSLRIESRLTSGLRVKSQRAGYRSDQGLGDRGRHSEASPQVRNRDVVNNRISRSSGQPIQIPFTLRQLRSTFATAKRKRRTPSYRNGTELKPLSQQLLDHALPLCVVGRAFTLRLSIEIKFRYQNRQVRLQPAPRGCRSEQYYLAQPRLRWPIIRCQRALPTTSLRDRSACA